MWNEKLKQEIPKGWNNCILEYYAIPVLKIINGNVEVDESKSGRLNSLPFDILDCTHYIGGQVSRTNSWKKNIMETIEEIRKNKTIPVIMLSAKSEDEDKIKGLNCGADDYVTKPFNPLELIARVNSGIRRYTQLRNYDRGRK